MIAKIIIFVSSMLLTGIALEIIRRHLNKLWVSCALGAIIGMNISIGMVIVMEILNEYFR